MRRKGDEREDLHRGLDLYEVHTREGGKGANEKERSPIMTLFRSS